MKKLNHQSLQCHHQHQCLFFQRRGHKQLVNSVPVCCKEWLVHRQNGTSCLLICSNSKQCNVHRPARHNGSVNKKNEWKQRIKEKMKQTITPNKRYLAFVSLAPTTKSLMSQISSGNSIAVFIFWLKYWDTLNLHNWTINIRGAFQMSVFLKAGVWSLHLEQ